MITPTDRAPEAYDLRVRENWTRGLLRLLAVAIPSLALATVAVSIFQDTLGVPNPSAVYLIAVVATAYVSGTLGAVVAALGSFVIYDFLFVDPRFTLTISDPAEYLGVVLLLFVGVVVGQLAALQRSRTEVARAREREAYTLFQISRALATRASTPAVLPEIAGILRSEAHMERVWIAIGADDPTERVAADTSSERPPARAGAIRVLRRMPGDEPAQWVRVLLPQARPRPDQPNETYRIRCEAQGMRFGSIWATRERGLPEPGATDTRLLAAAADQIGQVLAHDRLEAEAQAAEIARKSDELKSALLQSVSHDLRTPLATIRAAAGSLRTSSDLTDSERDESADAIDREVEYLNRMVTNLLDLSRIEAGALKAECDVFELDDLVNRSLERLRGRLAQHPLDIRLDAPPVEVDPIFLDSSVTNVIENAIKYTPPDVPIRLVAHVLDPAFVRLTIEDGGPGVPDDALGKLFDKFYRVPGRQRTSRSGTGIGLAVVRGLVETMGGRVNARRSELGGLAIDIDLYAASVHEEQRGESTTTGAVT
jgi:two-component system, OmpR family, sensor histidine kinase KdpD